MSSFTEALERPTHHTSDAATESGTQRERLPVLIFDTPDQMAYQVARRVANLIEERQATSKRVVLGLPTGSTPIGVYQHLIRMHREEGLDFSNVVTFNLDEYYPLTPDSLQSYHRFMRENFFDHVNIPEHKIAIPRGDLPADQVETHCLAYEHAIKKAGGIDLMLLGIGRSGHIGFNEPGSNEHTRTRLIVLDEITRRDAASDFFGDEYVPREALTMGVGTILDAREIILMATGENKAPIVQRAVEEPANRHVTATYLQLHRNTTVYVDQAAASALTREQTPWLVMPVDWHDAELSKRAVIWLSEKLDKAIMRLEAIDFYRHGLHGLAYAYDDLDHLLRRVFEDLRKRIAYPDQLPAQQRALVFSPHPDDDVISMGGMLGRLVKNGNDVRVAYMTNGSVAVFDADVRRSLRMVEMSHTVFDFNPETHQAVQDTKTRIFNDLGAKSPGEVDSQEVQQLKAYIRYAEAIAGLEVMGLDEEHAIFMDLPFYRTGRVKKDPVSEADVEIVLELLQDFAPEQVFVAGDLSDPHGTHRMCYVAIRDALKRYNDTDDPEHVTPKIWLYRGAWQEWEIHRADVFMPMSKADLDRKIEAIFKHESQKDRAMFPGAYDAREFWERARDRNTETAAALNSLGLPEFYAVEAYVTPEEM